MQNDSDEEKEKQQVKSAKVFESNWELPLIVSDASDKEKLLLDTLTLTWSKNTVKVSTCEQYIQEMYGNTGTMLLKNLIRALEDGDGKYGKQRIGRVRYHCILQGYRGR